MITLEQLLALWDCAKASANTDAACRFSHYLGVAEPRSVMLFDFFRDTFSEGFVPFYAYRKYKSSLAECDEEAKEELTRLNDEFMRSDAYERQVEIFNHLNQLRIMDQEQKNECRVRQGDEE